MTPMTPACRRPRRAAGALVAAGLAAVGSTMTMVVSTMPVEATPLAVVDRVDVPAVCCATAERIDPQIPPRDVVAIVGDSLTVGVTSASILGDDTIQNRLPDQGQATTLISARSGRTMAEGIAIIRSNRSAIRDADVVFVGLGTNDLFGNAGSTVAGAENEIERINQAIFEIDPTNVIVWIDVSVEAISQRTANFNAGLGNITARFDSIEVCPWRHRALATPGAFARDRIHLTTSGYRARRDIILACLAN